MILDKIRRITRDGRWIPEIDGLRFIAIISVLLFHIAAELKLRSGSPLPVQPRYLWLQDALDRGDRGVALFFVISGTILALPFARHALAAGRQVSLRKYYLRRLTRLEPPYILALCLFALMIFVYQRGRLEPGFWPHALASLFYLHAPIYGTMSNLNPVTWSLEVEVQFYILAPLFMLFFRIPGKAVRRSVLLAATLAAGLGAAPLVTHPALALSILYHLQFFLAGLFVADVFILDLASLKTNLGWDLAALVTLAYMFFAASLWSTRVLLPFFFILLVLAAMRSLFFQRFVSYPWIAAIGGMCYSIYLLHFALIAAFFKLTHRFMLPRLDFLAIFASQALLLGLPILITAAVFFLLVERPCMDPEWPRRLWTRVTGKSAPLSLSE